MIEANNQIETIGIQNWMEQLKKKYKQKRTRS